MLLYYDKDMYFCVSVCVPVLSPSHNLKDQLQLLCFAMKLMERVCSITEMNRHCAFA